MIIGYYHRIFFGGGTYYKLSKKDNENKYKFEYCHQSIPNYIPKAEEYIKKYDSLSVEGERFEKYFKEKIIVMFLDYNSEIRRIIECCDNATWAKISKQKYTANTLDDVCWDFYFGNDLNAKYFIEGYSVYPKEIEMIYKIFNEMKEKYIGDID